MCLCFNMCLLVLLCAGVVSRESFKRCVAFGLFFEGLSLYCDQLFDGLSVCRGVFPTEHSEDVIGTLQPWLYPHAALVATLFEHRSTQGW